MSPKKESGEIGRGFGFAGSRTDGSGLNHVADGETLDSLVLGNAASAVGAAHGLNVAAAVLVATARKSISYRSPEFANRFNRGSHSPSSGNVFASFCSISRCVPCALLVVIAEMLNGILLRRCWGVGLTCSPSS